MENISLKTLSLILHRHAYQHQPSIYLVLDRPSTRFQLSTGRTDRRVIRDGGSQVRFSEKGELSTLSGEVSRRDRADW